MILCFGLVRPTRAWTFCCAPSPSSTTRSCGSSGARSASTMPSSTAWRHAAPGRVRRVNRFVPDSEIPAIMRRADLVVLPYRDAEQSGVLATALAFGKPIVASAVGGFPEVAPAIRLVPPGDEKELARRAGRAAGGRARARAPGRGCAGGRPGPLLVGRDRATHAGRLPTASIIRPDGRGRDRLLGLRRAARAHARHLSALARRARRGCAPSRDEEPRRATCRSCH